VRIPWWERFFSALVGIHHNCKYDPLSSTSVPSFWSLPGNNLDNIQGGLPFAIEVLVGTVFGAIHCAAWNTDFPAALEKWMWRSCSSLIVAIPAIILLLLVLNTFIDLKESQLGEAILVMGILILISIYIIARLILIILPLIALRSLPSGAFVDVNWSVYIPHL
jgi:hypothetical protein